MLKGIPLHAERLTPRAYEYAHPVLPQALRETIAKLEPVARERWPLEAEALLAKAREKTGLDDFGDPQFRTSLQVLCRSAEEELELNSIGRRNLHGQILDHLMQRLRFEDLWKRRPEILDEHIDRPIFIVGLTRSGTSFLQHLLARNPELRCLPFWETINPLPQHDPAERPPQDEPLIEIARKNVEGLRLNAPVILNLHQLEAEEPDEEIYLFGPGFTSMIYEWNFILPAYADFLGNLDHTDGYRYLKRILQTLQWLRGGKRWLLKSPQHVGLLKPLLTVFPDATIVETFRDPATATVSIANLCTYGQRLRTDHPNPLATGAVNVRLVQRQIHAFLRDHPYDDPRFVPVHFKALMAEPLETVRRIHKAAELELTPAVERAMRDFIDLNRKVKHVKSEYAPQDFGIDVAQLRTSLRDYYERFGIEEDSDL